MYRKKIFYKKKFNKLFFIFILIILFILSFLFFFLNYKNNFIEIEDYYNPFYIVPSDKGGQKIPNQNKKGLHLSDFNIEKHIYNNNPNLNYSIQILTSENYDLIINKKNELITKKSSIIMNNDLFSAILNNNLGSEYLLLYKNFDTRESALDYCNKYVFFVKKCIVVDVQNLF